MAPRINPARKPMVPLKGGDQASYLTVDQVKRQHKPSDSWVSPHYGDGGWHETPGVPRFNPLDLIPLRDHILVRIFPEKVKYATIIRPENSAPIYPDTRRGVILAAGPGRWVDGDFYATEVKPGMEVSIGPHHDYQSTDAGYGDNIVLCQEADIRVIHGKIDGRSTPKDSH